MLTAAQNLEFERAAQLRDRVNEIKGAPTIESTAGGYKEEVSKIWQPKGNRGKGKKAKKS